MDFNNVINKRKSVHSFRDKKVDFRDILYAIDAANKAPTAGGFYTMRYLITEDPEKIKKLAKLADQAWIAGAPAIVVACSDERTPERLYGERGRIYSRQQAGAAIENFLLNIVNAGLSACWVGAYDDDIMKQLLGIPGHINIEAIIPIGYEDSKKSKKKSKRERPLENSIFWEKWENRLRPTVFKEVDRNELENPT